jgi:tryptophan synthase alpha chain
VGAVAAAGANGVIVGSALVRIIEEHPGDEAGMLESLRTAIGAMRSGLAADPGHDISRRERVEG